MERGGWWRVEIKAVELVRLHGWRSRNSFSLMIGGIVCVKEMLDECLFFESRFASCACACACKLPVICYRFGERWTRRFRWRFRWRDSRWLLLGGFVCNGTSVWWCLERAFKNLQSAWVGIAHLGAEAELVEFNGMGHFVLRFGRSCHVLWFLSCFYYTRSADMCPLALGITIIRLLLLGERRGENV